MSKIAGIYIIKNNINNKIYVGQSINVEKRIREHKKNLVTNKHTNFNLQNDWNLIGSNSFEFSIIEKVIGNSDEIRMLLNEKEDEWMDNFNTLDINYGYNKCNNSTQPYSGLLIIPEDHELFEPKASFRKDYTNSWMFLERVLKPIEFKAAFALALKAKANTNSLEPLNDDTAKSELMAILGVSKNMVNPILEKLYILGVYGRFDVYEVNKPYTKYWVFNPYLSFQGKLLKSDIALLFKNTHCARAFYDPEYNPILKK